jgi:hypothetical protein
MLDEAEWQRVFAVIPEEGFDPRSHVPRNLAFAGRVWLERYNAITRFGETNVNAVWHHRAAMYGPPCKN